MRLAKIYHSLLQILVYRLVRLLTCLHFVYKYPNKTVRRHWHCVLFQAGHELQMEYRPLHLRKSTMQNTMRLRSKVAMATRTYLDTTHGNH